MHKILGLDLGSNSIGWAVVDIDNKEILDTGVRVFQEGVENYGKGEREQSKNSARREKRQVRKQNERTKLRKRILMKVLRKNNMAPQRETKEFDEWIQLNPYEMRHRATKEEISLKEFGRALYHMSQRRGFKSNSRRIDTKESKTLFEGTDDKTGINETRKQMGDKTLGSYLYSIYPKEGEPFKQGQPRIRNRYTTREMYKEEFETIWDQQANYHDELTDELKQEIGGRSKEGYEKDGILFFQRPLQSQKHLIGKCPFESNNTKTPASSIPFEKFRALQFVNSIRCDGEPLNVEERESVYQKLLSTKTRTSFKTLKKKIGKHDEAYIFNYEDNEKIRGCRTISSLQKAFGKKWNELSDKKKHDIWHALYFFDDKEKLKEKAIDDWGLSEKKATDLSELQLKDGYASLSHKAISNILPFLEKGYTYDKAVALGGIRNAFGKQWNNLDTSDQQMIIDTTEEIIRNNDRGTYISKIRSFLREAFDLTEKQMQKLYHHSTDIHYGEKLDKLPTTREADMEIQSIRNPVVIQALFEVRKVVNELIDRFGSFDEIKVELARDLKLNKERRYEIKKRNEEIADYHEEIKEILERLGISINHETILKYKLWEECQHIDPYSGDNISLEELYSGNYEIEHIMPYSRSLNDSFMNKTLCRNDINKDKGNRTPYEYFTENGNWEKVKTRVKKLFQTSEDHPKRFVKYNRFVKRDWADEDDFISRQLNDTRYISREAKDYLSKICDKVRVAPGTATAKLRHMWGLNNLLQYDDFEKDRTDHRHHAIDAIVMAVHEPGHVKALSDYNRYEDRNDPDPFPDPWEDFYTDARESVENILVAHQSDHRILTKKTTKTRKKGQVYENKGVAARGQLHRESVYGKRKPTKGEEKFHIRKNIEDLNSKTHVNKVVDDTIRRLMEDRLRELDVDLTKNYKVPSGAFLSKDDNGNKIAHIKLPNSKGDPVPVFKVRLAENIGGAEQLKEGENAYVNPYNNHAILIYKNEQDNLKEKVITFWEAVEKKANNQNIYKLPEDGTEFECILRENDMFIIGLTEDELKDNLNNQRLLSDHLYRVQKISSSYYTFRKHIASTLKFKDQVIRIQSFKAWKEHTPIRVRLSPSGQIRIP